MNRPLYRRGMQPGPIATFSLAARDQATGDMGVVVASKFLGVGAYVPTAVAGVGAVATQAFSNVTFGPRAIELLRTGKTPAECSQEFERTDAGIQQRQFGIVAADGQAVTFTGSQCHAWAGGKSGAGYAAQGNILTGPEVVDALVDTFLGSSRPFPERLVAALAAAEAAGGDSRGRQSAALLVVGHEKGYAGLNDRWIDLRVDDHPEPATELARLLELHRVYLDKPSTEPRRLSAEDIRWLQGVLHGQGRLEGTPTGAWDLETETALEGLFGVENLEERWVGGPAVDPVAWAHLTARFGDR